MGREWRGQPNQRGDNGRRGKSGDAGGGERGRRDPQPAVPAFLEVLLLNAQSILGEMDELCCTGTELAPDIIMVKES
jgi:hypothetical protein